MSSVNIVVLDDAINSDPKRVPSLWERPSIALNDAPSTPQADWEEDEGDDPSEYGPMPASLWVLS